MQNLLILALDDAAVGIGANVEGIVIFVSHHEPDGMGTTWYIFLAVSSRMYSKFAALLKLCILSHAGLLSLDSMSVLARRSTRCMVPS